MAVGSQRERSFSDHVSGSWEFTLTVSLPEQQEESRS